MIKKLSTISLLVICFFANGCAQTKKASQVATSGDRAIAFPGAEGFGRFTTGGRGGRVIIVSNLNDAGPGSFREAVEMNKPRIVVFAVSGTIRLQSRLAIKGDITIAGQSAPGDGICIADYPVSLGGDNIIVRYLRFRMGDRYQNGGKVDGAGGDDAFGGTRRKNIIIDHCTMSWSTDEAFSIYAGDSTTIQWNLISEPLNYSYHFETGDKDFEQHGYGGIWGGKHLSAHHNLFAHCNSRTPRFDGNRNTTQELVDLRNNVIYNWGHNNAYAGEGGFYNVVGNYYKPGPSTSKEVQNQIVNPYNKPPSIPYGKFYVTGNFVSGSKEVTENNYLGFRPDKNAGEQDKKNMWVTVPFDYMSIPTETAEQAFASVLKAAGASWQRDTLDQRIVNDVKNGTGRFIDVQGGFPHGTPFEQTLTAWPALKAGPVLPDSDGDGMPDSWEKQKGLDPADAKDAATLKLHPFYTNIEVYLNSIPDQSK